MDPLDDSTVTEGYRALDLFIDRTELCLAFLRLINGSETQSDPFFIHGDGGNGKSLLLDYFRSHLCKRFEPDSWSYLESLPPADCIDQASSAENAVPVPAVRFDLALGPKDSFGALTAIRRGYASQGIRFPIFDFAVLMYLQKSNQLNKQQLQVIFPFDELSMASDLAELLLGVPGPSIVVRAAEIINKHLGYPMVHRRMRRRIDESTVQHILRLDPERELVRSLPYFLAMDLNARVTGEANDGSGRIVLLLDSHESLWGQDRSLTGELYFERDEWVRRLLVSLNLKAGILVFVAGRELPRWKDAPRTPLTEVNTLNLGGLSDNDAIEFLRRSGIADVNIQKHLLRGSRLERGEVHPLYLGLGVDAVLAAERNGITTLTEDLVGESPAGPRQRQWVIDRLLRYVSLAERHSIHALAAAQAFDSEVYDYLGRTLGFPTSKVGFQVLTSYSFVKRRDATNYSIHDLLKRVLEEQGGREHFEAHAALYGFFTLGPGASSPDSKVTSIYHLVRIDPERAFFEWFELFQAAIRSSRYPLCQSLLNTRTELRGLDHSRKALASSIVAEYYHRLGMQEEAISELSNSLHEANLHILRDPDSAEVINNKGIALVHLGEVEAALGWRDCAQQRYEEAREAHSEALTLSPNDLRYRSNLGRALQRLAELELLSGNVPTAERLLLDAAREGDIALNLAPNEPGLKNNLGVVKMHLGDVLAQSGSYSRAIAAYRAALWLLNQAILQEPQNSQFRFNKASLLQRRGKMYASRRLRRAAQRDYLDALVACDDALRLSPEYLRALAHKGMYCEELGWLIQRWGRPHWNPVAQRLYESGVEAFSRAQVLAPAEPLYKDSLVRIRSRLAALANR